MSKAAEGCLLHGRLNSSQTWLIEKYYLRPELYDNLVLSSQLESDHFLYKFASSISRS